MKYFCLFMLSIAPVTAQTTAASPGSVVGTVIDAKTQKSVPVPSALVIANRAGAPPFSKNTKTGADGVFQIKGLPPGNYSICVQAPADQYLDPCLWGGAPTTVGIASGQSVSGISVKLTAASVLNIQVQDAQKALSQLTKDGRHPDLHLGVWGPNGLYYPAHPSGGAASTGNPAIGTAATTHSYQLAVPRDTTLKFYIASTDLKLGDSGGLALLANASQQGFQHTTGDSNPKSFTFSILGLLH